MIKTRKQIVEQTRNEVVKQYTANLQILMERINKLTKDYDIENYLTPSQIEVITKFNIWSKERLAQKIIDHYYMREIGFETPRTF